MSPGGRSVAAWSPSGDALALSLTEGTCPTWQPEIVDAGGVHPLGSSHPTPQTVSWSPDAESVVVGGTSFPDDVAVYDAAGGRQATVARGRNPAWSPDGDTIAYTGADGGIHLVAPDGTGGERVAAGDRAAWSPDGGSLAYVREGAVFVADSTGAEERAIGRGEAAAWSPDGGALAVDRGTATAIVPLDGSPERAVGTGSLVGWSSDGSAIALLSLAGVVRLVDLESGSTRRVGEDAEAAAVPDDWDRVATVLRVRDGTEVYVAEITGAHPKRAVGFRCGRGSGCRAGTDGADRIVGLATRDVVYAGAGDDRIFSRGGHDRIEGAYGRDRVDAGPGNDVVLTHGNDDVIVGGPGTDGLTPGDGEDRIDGGRGRDWITVSGDGRVDRVQCGPGRDVVYADAVDRVARDCETVRREP